MEKKHNPRVSPARELALNVINEVTEKGAYANLALDKSLSASALNIQEKKTVSEIANGTIRMIKRLDWVLNLFMQKGVQKQNPWVRNILRMSVYQLIFMDRIPDYACVNDAVELTRWKTKQQALGKLVNGVLRNIIRSRDELNWPADNNEFMAVYYSHPEWMVDLFLKLYGKTDAVRLLEYNNTPAHVVFRNNNLNISRQDLIKLLEAEGVVCSKSTRTPWGINIQKLNNPISSLKAYQTGSFYVQNESSMLAAPILDPGRGDMVYDLCAGVGGKTTHLAEYMHNEGRILAFDIYAQKIDILKQNCSRLGIKIVDSFVCSALEISGKEAGADRILVDAPCSGLGVLNRRSDARWRKISDLKGLTEIQAGLLRKAADLLRPGGLLLYATCTITPEENENAVLDLLKERDFELEDFAARIEFWGLDEMDRQHAAQGMLTIIPGKYDTDGMFYALMRRTG